jgi:predicted RNase H-like nuclease (RuvC/YqgF family)
MQDSKAHSSNFSELENRIQKLISLHEQMKDSNQGLVSDIRRLRIELEEERSKTSRMEEGYRNLKEMEKTGNRQSITQIKKRINDIIGEIDKNISLLNGQNK